MRLTCWPGSERAFREEHLVAGRHRHEQVGGERLLSVRPTWAPMLRGGPLSLAPGRGRRERPRGLARGTSSPRRLPFTPAPTTAAVSASGRPSVSAASTAAAPVRRAVTAPASRTARSVPFDASESRTSAHHRRQPLRGVSRKGRHPLERSVPAAERGHRPEVACGIRGHVDLRRHRPLAARVGDEGVAHRLECALRRDRRLHVLRGKDRNLPRACSVCRHRSRPVISDARGQQSCHALNAAPQAAPQTDFTAAINFSIAAFASSNSITVFGS